MKLALSIIYRITFPCHGRRFQRNPDALVAFRERFQFAAPGGKSARALLLAMSPGSDSALTEQPFQPRPGNFSRDRILSRSRTTRRADSHASSGGRGDAVAAIRVCGGSAKREVTEIGRRKMWLVLAAKPRQHMMFALVKSGSESDTPCRFRLPFQFAALS
jgi:hypothetical protein